MLIGIDVYHAKMRFLEKLDVYVQRRSVGAFVAILVNVNTGDYLTSNHVVEVKAKVELFCKAESDSETSSVKSDSNKNSSAVKVIEAPEITREDSLAKFIERSIAEHKVTPDQIIVYRDGVGDSMLDCVSKTEVKQVQNACKSAKLIFAVAQKRIHARFIVDGGQKGFGNPANGTVIEEAVSHHLNEFYLVPTTCSLSTVRPVRYILLWNDNTMPLNEFQSLTYGLCHVYPNWPDSITLPFPTQLAHKLAFLLGENLQSTMVHKNLYTNYFYL